jgi:hypothetical protein
MIDDTELGVQLDLLRDWAIRNGKWEYFEFFIKREMERNKEQSLAALGESKDRQAAVNLGRALAFEELFTLLDNLITTALAERAEANSQDKEE